MRLQGRQIYTEGYGLAAAYIADHLRQWGVKPMGDDGTYFQSVKMRGYRVTRNSSVTVEVNGQSRTFKHGDHVTFALGSGGKQTLNFNGVEFVGYGIVALPSAANNNVSYNDFQGREVKGKAVMWMPGTPTLLTQGGRGRGAGGNRANYAIQTARRGRGVRLRARSRGADASRCGDGSSAGRAGRGPGGGGECAGRRSEAAALARAAARLRPAAAALSLRRPPTSRPCRRSTASCRRRSRLTTTFYEFLFSGVHDEVRGHQRSRGRKGELLTPIAIPNAKVTVNIDNTYDVISTQLSKNVVGMIEGSDPKLKDTYVLFGAHLDHVGYRTAATAGRGGRAGGQGAARTGHAGRAGSDLQRRRRRRVRIDGACWASPRRSRQGRSRSARSSSCGTRARSPGCSGRATWPISRSSRSRRSRRSSTST